MKKLFLFLCITALIAGCAATKQPTGKFIIKGIEVTPDKVIIHGTLKVKGITPEILRQKINEASQQVLSIDKLYIDQADTSSNADITVTTPNPQ